MAIHNPIPSTDPSKVMSQPTPFQQRTLWNAATGVSIMILGALMVGLVWLIGKVFGFLPPVLIPLIVAGIIAYVLDPVVRFLQTRGFSRLWSVVTLYAAILASIALLVIALIPAVNQGRGLLKKTYSKPVAEQQAIDENNFIDEHQNERLAGTLASELIKMRQRHQQNPIGWMLTEVDDQGNPVTENTGGTNAIESLSKSRAGRMLFEYKGVILKTGREWISAGSTKVLGFLGLVLGMIMVPVYLFFFLKDSSSIREHWHDYVPLKNSEFKTELVETLQEINGYLVSFFRGQVLVAAIDGFLVGTALTLFGLPYGFLIGIFMAILGVIPYIGSILCLIPACIIGYLHAQGSAPFGMSPAAYVGCVVAIFVFVQQINSLVTAPKIVGDSVGLHPLTVIFSMLFWSLLLGGFVGALLAVPLSAAVKVLFRRYIWVRGRLV